MGAIIDFPMNQLMGKNAYARVTVPLWRDPVDSAKPVFQATKGSLIGKIEGWVSPRSGRSDTYLMFLDQNNKAYYAKFDDKLDSNKLEAQGAKTDKQVTAAAEDKKDKSWLTEFLEELGLDKAVNTLLWLGAGVVVYREINRGKRKNATPQSKYMTKF